MLFAWLAIGWLATARGDIVTFDLKDATRDTGWQIKYDDSVVSVSSTTGWTGNATGSNEGTLQIDKVFKGLDPIDIQFVEINKAAADAFGLRITLNENVHNQTGQDWTGFRMDLIDTNAVSDQGSRAHPGFAHFHPDNGGFLAPPFSLVGAPPQNNANGNTASSLIFGNGTFGESSARAFQNFGIHQYEDMGLQRNFILRETVPEPAAWASFVVGLIAAVGLFLRKKNEI